MSDASVPLLVAVDFSACSRRAAEAAAALARDLDRSLVVVHAFTQHARGMGIKQAIDPINAVFAEGQLDDALRLTQDWLEPLRRQAGVELVAEEGARRKVMAAALEKHGPSMVFVGHHGHGGTRLGSLAKWLLDNARCPVVVVPDAPEE